MPTRDAYFSRREVLFNFVFSCFTSCDQSKFSLVPWTLKFGHPSLLLLHLENLSIFRVFIAHVLYTIQSNVGTDVKPWLTDKVEKRIETLERKLDIVADTATKLSQKSKDIDDGFQDLKKLVYAGYLSEPANEKTHHSGEQIDKMQDEKVEDNVGQMKTENQNVTLEALNHLENQIVSSKRMVMIMQEEASRKETLIQKQIIESKEDILSLVQKELKGKCDYI